MSNVITNNFNTSHNEFISYDRITDVLLPFSQNINLCFNVKLAYKNKDNERRFMHSESQYPAQKYTGNPDVVSIKRMMNFYFSIEDTCDRDNWILLGAQNVFFLKDFLKTNVLPWYPGYGTGVYESGETGLMLSAGYETVVFRMSGGRSLGFEPALFDTFRGDTYPGVRMYINGGRAVAEIGYDLLMSFYYILENTDMYSVASSMLAYVKAGPYGTNRYVINGNGGNDNFWQR